MRQHEMEELQHIYEERGLPKELAKEVALHLTKNDAVQAHARDELNIDPEELANPGQVRRVTSLAVQRTRIGARCSIVGPHGLGVGASQ